ncbi:MAG: M3 family oligoendopeptidase [Erysipelotrichaceae bacterium]|nr:M3 family oligoendopeptidase [Erysipelotrichaceae bacterium]
MKFSEYKYERPDYEACSKQLDELLKQLGKIRDGEEFWQKYQEIQKINDRINTMSNIAMIRHSIDTRDPFYDAENDYWNETLPLYSVYDNRLATILLDFPEREKLYVHIPKVLFALAECRRRSFDEKIVGLMQKENRLASEYGKLKANAAIEFEGKTYNLNSIGPLMESSDGDVRRRASLAQLRFFEEHEEDFDRIYDELVKVRTQMAHQLGYENYTKMAYQRMSRVDYDQAMVANYRRQIIEEIVPVAEKLYQRQAARLGKPYLPFYDEKMEFASGNPTPKGTYEELIQAAKEMYHAMSPETAEFIDMMIEGENWDLKSRDGKETGGYCTGIVNYRTPFIFANFNGTSGDVDVLTHEAGHAFQYYCSRDIPVTECQWPTMESAEIHSMTMEFNAWKWIDKFFKEDTAKYKYLHLGGAVKFLPYGALVDHFQHEVYDHPEMTPAQRKQCYRQLEKQYLPHKHYEEAPLLERGGYWYRQGHIFSSPFYYIDYTLAQVCALQFWVRQYNKDENAWADYLKLCRLGGTESFTELVRDANLKVPFDDGCLKSVAENIEEYLMSVDDRRL